MKSEIKFYEGDLPNDIILGKEIAIDTEALGLNNHRDRLCLIQLTDGNGIVYVIRFQPNQYKNCPNIKKILKDPKILKIMHFARFDMAILQQYLKVKVKNVYCTKIASKIARTYTDAHGLKAIVKELFDINLDKKEQSSYWGAENLSKEQIEYSIHDVLYLHRIKEKLNQQLKRENRIKLAYDCFKFLNTRVDLDLLGWIDCDIFSHE